MKKIILFSTLFINSLLSFASDIIPIGGNNNTLYYKMGGGSDFVLPPVQDTHTINLNANADLGSGYACGAFNPALSISNALNSLKDSEDNIEQSILTNATGSVIEMPMYFLAQANPTFYSMINNALLKIHDKVSLSTKSCQEVKNQIAQGKNPYQDWATLSVNDQWKKHLSLTATGQEDINDANKDVDQHAGKNGVPWVQGNQDNNGAYYAGGLNQPPVHVIADTTKAGYNALLMRDLNSNDPAPQGGNLANTFSTPNDAVKWITNVVGDQTITTCTDTSCKLNQNGISGRGLLPWITSCNDDNKNECADTLRDNIANLVTNQTPITKENLEKVSAEGLAVSPEVINAIHNMDSSQQTLVINKLSQEVATQKVMSRALIARNILQTGSQVPIIAANQPAQNLIHQAMQNLDKDIQSLAFESQIRKQMMSDTLSQVLGYQSNQEKNALLVPKITPQSPLMQNSSISNSGEKR